MLLSYDILKQMLFLMLGSMTIACFLSVSAVTIVCFLSVSAMMIACFLSVMALVRLWNADNDCLPSLPQYLHF